MANKIEIKALMKMDAAKRAKFKFDEYKKKSAQMVQPTKGTTSVAFIFEGDVMVVDDSRASMGSYIFCDDSVQQECYRPLDMAASMDTHANVTAVPQTFSSHEGRQIKSMAEGNVFENALSTHIRGRSHLWRELRNHVVTDGSSAIACAHDVCPNRVVRSRLGLLGEIKKSDDGISQEDPTHCANAASGVPDPVCLGVPPCFTQNQVSETCEMASYNTNYQGRASHGSLLPANVHQSFPSRNVNICVMAKEQTHVGIFVIEHVDSGKSTTAEKMEDKAWSVRDEKALVVQEEKTLAVGRIGEGMGRQRTNGAHVIFILKMVPFDSAKQSIPKETSYDPFNIYDILNKENKDVNAAATNSSIPFPPGFKPDKPDTDVGEPVAQKDQFQPDVKSVGSSSHTVESANNVDDQFSTGSIENIQKKKESGSILEILEEMISIPIKVNVLAWKISMDRLPTRVNLHRRGVQVSPISCPICCEALENLDHLLFCCDLAKDIARSICNWWGLVWNPVDSYRSWFNLVQLQSSSKQVLEGVFYTS
nr:RNA-directed DNA polymerase, eukaryota [Tanacetum cinerariifolium]